MQFLKSRENNTKFFTDLMKKQILNKKTKNKYQISNCRVCENSTVSATPPLPPPPTHTHHLPPPFLFLLGGDKFESQILKWGIRKICWFVVCLRGGQYPGWHYGIQLTCRFQVHQSPRANWNLEPSHSWRTEQLRISIPRVHGYS